MTCKVSRICSVYSSNIVHINVRKEMYLREIFLIINKNEN